MPDSPLQQVKRQYGDKEKLVEAVVSALEKFGEESDDLRDRLRVASNKKLLRLAAVTDAISQRYGTREKLIEAIANGAGKSKDQDFRNNHLGSQALAQLLDKANAAEKRARSRS